MASFVFTFNFPFLRSTKATYQSLRPRHFGILAWDQAVRRAAWHGASRTRRNPSMLPVDEKTSGPDDARVRRLPTAVSVISIERAEHPISGPKRDESSARREDGPSRRCRERVRPDTIPVVEFSPHFADCFAMEKTVQRARRTRIAALNVVTSRIMVQHRSRWRECRDARLG